MMRVTFSKLENGRWEAVACDESPPVLLKDVGEDQDWPPIYMSPQRFIAHGATPWEASAALFAGHEEWHPSMRAGWPTVGDCEIDWASLPWTEKRIAYGIVLGVIELFGMTPSAQAAIAAALPKKKRRGMRKRGASRRSH